jgi:SpoIIAA-like
MIRPSFAPRGESVVVRLSGHLTKQQLENELEPVEERLSVGALSAVIVDCSSMDGYDVDARAHFTAWLERHRSQMPKIAVVTHNRLYHLVISAMRLATGARVKAFDTLEEARAWV